MSRQIKCPNCGKMTEYTTQNKARPFCSERCQLIDLGEWAAEKYAVPVVNKTPDEKDLVDIKGKDTDDDEA